MGKIQDKIDKIVKWLKEYKEKTNSKGFIVGVSGGIDSAVVAKLIYMADPENSIGVILPIKSSQSDLDDANEVVQNIGINSMTLDLVKPHSEILEMVRENLVKNKIGYNKSNDKITDANLRARLRMSAIYAIANNLGYLVVGTDNKDELYTGYFTKHGDGGVDILPMGSIYKSEVYEIAKALNLPDCVISKAPSAGLWEGQTDEGEMGVTYNEIERYIQGEEVSEKSRQTIERLHNNSQHKRNVAPFPII